MILLARVFTFVFLAAGTAQAEMSMFWEDLRAGSVSLSAQSCEGVARAYNMLVYRAETYGDPTAMNSLAWLSVNTNCGDYYDGDQFRATDLICAAAKAGYPLAMSNCGMRHITSLGTDQDVAEGVRWIEAAMGGGYALAGAFLAKQYILGEHIPKNRNEADYWLERAEREGAPRDIIEAEWKRFEAEFGTQQPGNGPGQAKPATKEWLPPFSGFGFHRVGNMCVLRNGPVTLATKQQAGDTLTLVGITDPDFDFSGKVGGVLNDHELRVMFGTSLFGDIVVEGVPRVGATETLVVRMGEEALKELWYEHDVSCAVEYARADIESGQYWLLDAEGERKVWKSFGDLGFWERTNWLQFRDCAGVFLFTEQCR